MSFEIRNVDLIGADWSTTSAEVLLWEEDLEDDEMVKLSLRFRDREITKTDTDFFSALCSIRRELEKENLMIACYGASKNVYPSPMLRSMGYGDKAYKLTMGKPARQEDIVSLFDSDKDVFPTTVDEQEKFYEEWLRSLS